MIKPEAVNQDEDVSVVGKIFDSPMVVKGWTWLPLTQLITWAIMVREAGRLHPDRKWYQKMGIAAGTMPVILGTEWLHNLAHAAAAKMVGHPVDAIRIVWGMPLLVYHDIEDTSLSPKQHIIRSLGGPVINTILWYLGVICKRFTRFGTPAHDIIDAFKGTNAFLVIAGLTPQPWFDGGAVLKWALVDRGDSLEKADEKVRKVNYVTAAGMGTVSGFALKKRKRLLGGLLAMLAAISVGTAAGWFREK
jgi:Zn-dependent protease